MVYYAPQLWSKLIELICVRYIRPCIESDLSISFSFAYSVIVSHKN